MKIATEDPELRKKSYASLAFREGKFSPSPDPPPLHHTLFTLLATTLNGLLQLYRVFFVAMNYNIYVYNDTTYLMVCVVNVCAITAAAT